jgi:hypothetical protein
MAVEMGVTADLKKKEKEISLVFIVNFGINA